MLCLILISSVFPQEIKLNVACNMIAIEPNNRMRLPNCRKRAIKGHQTPLRFDAVGFQETEALAGDLPLRFSWTPL